ANTGAARSSVGEAPPGESVTPSEEQDRVRRARAGDRDAFAALVDLYWGRILGWLSGLTGRADLAEDLTRDVFVRAWVALPRLKSEPGFGPWLSRIARNRYRDSRRGPRAAPSRPLPPQAASPQPAPVETLVEREGAELLRSACARLPPTYRAAYL